MYSITLYLCGNNFDVWQNVTHVMLSFNGSAGMVQRTYFSDILKRSYFSIVCTEKVFFLHGRVTDAQNFKAEKLTRRHNTRKCQDFSVV